MHASFCSHQKGAKGCHLLELVCQHLNIVERDFFALSYVDKREDKRDIDGREIRVSCFIFCTLHFVTSFVKELGLFLNYVLPASRLSTLEMLHF